uniref:B-type MADS-box protein PI-1 n=2 Tax=Anthurium TaxID=78377 RepID=A0A1U8VH37_ANTAD|nr:B-type MADS-box protein PI-1 [Anthurium andraeanum]
MGRGRIEIKRIENSTNRQVTFSKRKTGIIKKAREISVLCDAKVYLLVFSSSGKMAEFCSDNTTLSNMLEQYQKTTGNKIWDAKHESLDAEIDRIKRENDNMQIELRHLKGEDIGPLGPYELIPLEETLQRGLAGVRKKQMECWKRLKKSGRSLEEDNQRLSLILQQHELSKDVGMGELDQEYQQKERDYAIQMPFSFCGQPIQHNLDESK